MRRVNDATCLAWLLIASTSILAGGTIHALRTRLDAVSTLAIAGMTTLSGLMTAGAINAAA